MVGLAASLPVDLNRFGHIQIFMVAIHAKLKIIFEMAIGYVVKHNRLPHGSFYNINSHRKLCILTALLDCGYGKNA